MKSGNPTRVKQSKSLIDTIKNQHEIVTEFEKIQKSKNVKRRVTHHDTKISKVLFDENGKGICVIDLDTIMPGYFISDHGDMFRTYLSPANEEVKDFGAIDVRDGLSSHRSRLRHTMGDELTKEEQTVDIILQGHS